MKKIQPVSTSRIAKSKKLVKGKKLSPVELLEKGKQDYRELMSRTTGPETANFSRERGKDTKYFLKLNRKYLLIGCENLTAFEVLAKEAIDLHISKFTGEAMVKYKTLLPLSHLSYISLRRAISGLEKKKIFKIQKTSGGCNRYIDVQLKKKIKLC